MKTKLILVAAMLMGLLAAGLVYQYLQNVERDYQQRQVTGQVVVARENIPARTRLNLAMLVVRDVPAVYIQSGAARETTEVLGAVSNSVIYAGEQVLKARVVTSNDPSQGLAYVIAAGKRAITLAVNEVTAVAGFPVPGDRLDLVVHVGLPDKRVLTRLLLQDIRVLATGPLLRRSGGLEPVKDLKNITVEVTPEEALALVTAAREGEIWLMLRPAVPEDKVTMPVYRLEQLGE